MSPNFRVPEFPAELRAALLAAAEDEHPCVRAEAILGLAERDKNLALPLIRRELARDCVYLPVFEAATLVADHRWQMTCVLSPNAPETIISIASLWKRSPRATQVGHRHLPMRR